jgi:hypothetical protein
MSGSKTPHDTVVSIDGGPLWITVFVFRLWLNLRPGEVTRGKWRIPDEKGESGLFSCSELRWW